VANTLAYHDTTTITAVKSFIVQGPDVFRLNGVQPEVAAPEKSTVFWSKELLLSDELTAFVYSGNKIVATHCENFSTARH
jgi:hypothetical protein